MQGDCSAGSLIEMEPWVLAHEEEAARAVRRLRFRWFAGLLFVPFAVLLALSLPALIAMLQGDPNATSTMLGLGLLLYLSVLLAAPSLYACVVIWGDWRARRRLVRATSGQNPKNSAPWVADVLGRIGRDIQCEVHVLDSLPTTGPMCFFRSGRAWVVFPAVVSLACSRAQRRGMLAHELAHLTAKNDRVFTYCRAYAGWLGSEDEMNDVENAFMWLYVLGPAVVYGFEGFKALYSLELSVATFVVLHLAVAMVAGVALRRLYWWVVIRHLFVYIFGPASTSLILRQDMEYAADLRAASWVGFSDVDAALAHLEEAESRAPPRNRPEGLLLILLVLSGAIFFKSPRVVHPHSADRRRRLRFALAKGIIAT